MRKNKLLSAFLVVSAIVLASCGMLGNTSTSTLSSASSTSQSVTTTTSAPTTSTPTTSAPTSSSISSGTNTSTASKLYKATLDSNAPDYYNSLTGLKGLELKEALHELIDDHTTYSYNSQINGFMKIYDRDLENNNNMIFVYTGSAKDTTTFDKEHVWAKSHGGFDTSKGTGSDLYNLRPCIPGLNSSRGNKDFAMGGDEYSSYPGNYATSSTFEPSDAFKGDVARIMFYMATRYDGDDNYSDSKANVDLELNAPSLSRYVDLSKGAATHGNFDDLYDWATSGIDPVDNYEVNRNNIIYKDYQHNRNPFVDHPEFIIMIYDKNYDGPGALIDLDGQGTTTANLVDKTIETINSLGTITLDSEDAILEAERLYEQLDASQKNKVTNYQTLIDARNTYNALFSDYKVSVVEDLIDKLPDVITLSDKDAIVTAEDYYNLLTNEEKAKVTNYQDLVAAREELDEIIGSVGEPSIIYEGSLGDVKTQGSYTSGEFSLSSKTWYADKYYKSGEFRLGHNKVNSLASKFTSALGLSSSTDGSSMEMKFDVENSYVFTINTTGIKYGTVNKVYILKSTDGGNTYTKCAEFDYSTTTMVYEYEGEVEESCRYAIVITGSKPRMVIESIEITGLEK